MNSFVHNKGSASIKSRVTMAIRMRKHSSAVNRSHAVGIKLISEIPISESVECLRPADV